MRPEAFSITNCILKPDRSYYSRTDAKCFETKYRFRSNLGRLLFCDKLLRTQIDSEGDMLLNSANQVESASFKESPFSSKDNRSDKFPELPRIEENSIHSSGNDSKNDQSDNFLYR